MPILLIVPVFSTLFGGLLAVRLRGSLTLLMALGAGLLLGAAFLDLLPEAISLGDVPAHAATGILGMTLVSFLGFFAVEFLSDAAAKHAAFSSSALGKATGAMLIFHSLRDGMAIGLSYAASHRAGYAVAVGIAAHDLGDGMNTILLTTRGKRPRWSDYCFLAADSLAPLAGGLLTIYWKFSAHSSAVLLAVAAGFFLQMATSDFLPQVRTQSRDPHERTMMAFPAVFAGVAIIYAANLMIGRMN